MAQINKNNFPTASLAFRDAVIDSNNEIDAKAKNAPSIVSDLVWNTSKTITATPGKAYKFIIRGGNSIQEWLWLSASTSTTETAYKVAEYGSGLTITCTANSTNKTLTFTGSATFLLKGIEI